MLRSNVFIAPTRLKLCEPSTRHIDRNSRLIQAGIEFLWARTNRLGVTQGGASTIELRLRHVTRRLSGANLFRAGTRTEVRKACLRDRRCSPRLVELRERSPARCRRRRRDSGWRFN